MARHTYATPTDDLTAWRAAAPGPDDLPPHLVAFLQCGVAATIGVRGCDGRPVVGAGVACRVDPDGRVRILAPRRPNLPVLAALEAGSAIAATFSRARDHRSVQLKAQSVTVTEILPGDACEAARQAALLADDLVELGYTRPQADGYVAHATDLVSLGFRPDRIFSQTPGPGAGAELVR